MHHFRPAGVCQVETNPMKITQNAARRAGANRHAS
jgi:hypothetical protein